MNKPNLVSKQLIIFAISLGLLLAVVVVTATTAGYYAVPGTQWQVMSGGGAPAAFESGSVSINGSLGQTIIGPSSNGGLELSSGFWYGVSGEISRIYLPITNNH